MRKFRIYRYTIFLHLKYGLRLITPKDSNDEAVLLILCGILPVMYVTSIEEKYNMGTSTVLNADILAEPQNIRLSK